MRATQKAIRLSLSAVLLLGAAGLTACNDNNNDTNGKVNTQSVRNSAAHRQNLYSYDGNASTSLSDLKYSKTLSRKVTEVNSVRTAHVMTNGDEAFVAVSLNGSNSSSQGQGVSDMNPNAAGAGNVTGRTSTLGRPTGQGVNPGGSDYRAHGTASGVGGGNQYNGARLGGGLGVNATNTGDTGFGGMGGGNMMTGPSKDAEVPENVKQDIENKIKASDKNITKVYISTNSDFFNRAGSYGTGADGNGLNGAGTGGNGTNLGNDVADIGSDVTGGVRNTGRDIYDMIADIFPNRNNNNNTTGTTGTNRNISR